MSHRELEGELHSLANLIRDHVMYPQEYETKRGIFQQQLLIIIFQFTQVRLDPRIPLEIEVLLADPTLHGLKKILTQAHRDIIAALKLHPENQKLKKEEIRWLELIQKIKA